MAFCKYCGNQIADDAKFCPACGAAQEKNEEQKTEQASNGFTGYEPVKIPSSGKMSVGYLVWSILNIIFCCWPFAIVGLVMTVTARDADTAEEEAQKLKKAKGWNLAATITAAVVWVLYIVYCFVIAFAIAAGL